MSELDLSDKFSFEDINEFSFQTCDTSMESHEQTLPLELREDNTKTKSKGKFKHAINRMFGKRKTKTESTAPEELDSTQISLPRHDHHLLNMFKTPKNKVSSLENQTNCSDYSVESMAKFCSSSFRRNKLKSSSHIQLLDESWEDWLAKYQKGETNLSEVGRPTCFNGFGHMAPPLYPLETARLKVLAKVNSPQAWRAEIGWLQSRLRQLCSQYKIKSASVSLIQKTAQQIIWQMGLFQAGNELQYLSRDLSLDAHTILSQGYFAILDCSSDWRTKLNPLVHGPPFIKFYCGVAIVVDKMPIGCISVSDPYLKSQVMVAMVEELTEISEQLTRNLEGKANPKLDFGLHRIRWDDGEAMNESKSVKSNSHTPCSKSNEAQDIHSESSLSENGSITSSPPFTMPSNLSEWSVKPTSKSLTYRPICCKTLLQPFEVFESLLRCQSINQAIKKACKLVKENLGADVVYLAEIRWNQNVLRSSLRNYTHLVKYGRIPFSELEKLGEKIDFCGVVTPKVRLVGNCRPAIDIDVERYVQLQAHHLQSAVLSRYGLQFDSHVQEGFRQAASHGMLIKAGMLIPLRRTEPYFQINKDNCSLVCGGYVMAALVDDVRHFSPGDQTFMKKVVRALENILTCYNEVTLHREKSD